MYDDGLIQLYANITFGLSPAEQVDYSGEVAELELTAVADTVELPPRFGDTEIISARSFERWTASLRYHRLSGQDSLWRLLWDSRNLPADLGAGRMRGEIYFTGTYHPGPSDYFDNPRFGGWMMIRDIKVGAPVKELREHRTSWPARAVTILDAEPGEGEGEGEGE